MCGKIKYKTLIVDDHKIFRDGLKIILASISEIGELHEASTGAEFLRKTEEHDIELVFMDIGLPDIDGLQACKMIENRKKKPKIIILSSYDESKLVLNSLKTDISGYLLKTVDFPEIEIAVKAVMAGKKYFCGEVLQNIKNDINNRESATKINLSKRETEILKLLCEGYNAETVAEKLFISKRTVETHKQNLLRKTNTENTTSLVLFALKNIFFKT